MWDYYETVVRMRMGTIMGMRTLARRAERCFRLGAVENENELDKNETVSGLYRND